MTRDEFIEEMRAMHNHIVVVGDTDLGRLVGFHEDKIDYYYHVRHKNGYRWANKKNNNSCHHSAVGPCVSLKGRIERYDVMDRIFAMNGAPPSDEFIISADEWDGTQRWTLRHEIENIYWRLRHRVLKAVSRSNQ